MKSLVVSGGGSKGAFAGGIAEYLIRECGNNYDLFVGSSTGSLLLPHLALNKIDKIKNIFTSVTQDDIFSICPFFIKKNKDGYNIRINHFNTLKTFIKGCPTFGESDNLFDLIKESLTVEEFELLKYSDKKIIVTVSNLSKDTIEYKHLDKCSYQDFIEWSWASCNFIPFMSILNKDNSQYADGGFGSFIPILSAIENGATEVDVIILHNEMDKISHPRINNAFALLFRTIKFVNHQISSKDIVIGKLKGSAKNVPINFYYTPHELTENPLIFDPDSMTEWWNQGYEFAKSVNERNNENKEE